MNNRAPNSYTQPKVVSQDKRVGNTQTLKTRGTGAATSGTKSSTKMG